MSQNDYTIANQSAPDFRSDLNDALQALASLSSGSTAPSTTYANMLWYDTANNILKMRTEADDAWINIGTLDQSTNTFAVAGATLSESTWIEGTSTTEGIVSPAEIKAAIDANAGGGIGDGQTWQDVSASRSMYTSYQNTTGKPIMVSARFSSSVVFQVSDDNSTWVRVSQSSSLTAGNTTAAIIPNNHYYRSDTPSGSFDYWSELR